MEMVVRKIINSLLKGECTSCTLMTGIALASCLYWVANRYADPYLLNDLMDGPLIAVSFTAGAYYLTWSLFNCHMLVDRAFMLRFGICIAWLGNGVWRVSRFLYAQGVLRGPIGAHDSWRGYMILLMVIAGILHIMAIDMTNGYPRRSKVIVASLAVSMGLAVMAWVKL